MKQLLIILIAFTSFMGVAQQKTASFNYIMIDDFNTKQSKSFFSESIITLDGPRADFVVQMPDAELTKKYNFVEGSQRNTKVNGLDIFVVDAKDVETGETVYILFGSNGNVGIIVNNKLVTYTNKEKIRPQKMQRI